MPESLHITFFHGGKMKMEPKSDMGQNDQLQLHNGALTTPICRKMKCTTALLLKIVAIGIFLPTIFVNAASLDDEAKKVVMSYYKSNNKYALCGGSVYSDVTSQNTPKTIIQIKGYEIKLKNENVSYADTLNGIEWKGYGALVPKAARFYTQGTGWTEWHSFEDVPLDLIVEKKKGQWSVVPTAEKKAMLDLVSPISCKSIEGLPK